MNDRTPHTARTARVRLVAPIAALALVLAGTTAAFASGAFESNDSGVDSARDIAERGSAPASTTASLPEGVDDHGNDAAPGVVAARTGTADTETESSLVVPDGAMQAFLADAAGTVTIRRDGATLTVVTVSPNAGWVPEVEQGAGAEVEVNFENGTMRIDFDAELDDGAVRVRVRVRDDAVDDQPQLDNSGPGNAVDNSGPANPVDNSGPGSIDDDHGTDDSGHDLGDDHSGHGGDDTTDDSGSGHSGSGRG